MKIPQSKLKELNYTVFINYGYDTFKRNYIRNKYTSVTETYKGANSLIIRIHICIPSTTIHAWLEAQRTNIHCPARGTLTESEGQSSYFCNQT